MPSLKDNTPTGSPAKAALKTSDTTLSGRRGKAAFRNNPFATYGTKERAPKKARGEDLANILLAPEGEDPYGKTPSSGIGSKITHPASLKTAFINMDTTQESKAGATDHNREQNLADLRGEE